VSKSFALMVSDDSNDLEANMMRLVQAAAAAGNPAQSRVQAVPRYAYFHGAIVP